MTRPIVDLDRPLPELTAAVRELVARQQAARIADGAQAEQRHLLHDADPDSVVPAFPDLTKGHRS